MIQTQLLKLDPPYQIICANGHVGIQVATLIVTEERAVSQVPKTPFTRSYYVHRSYPVVNYGLKQGLEEQLKYNNPYPDFVKEYELRRRMQPEGAVWDGVEVKDVRILGLAGANNNAIELDYFVYLIPTVRGFDPSLHVWDKKSTSRIYDFYTGLGNVGLKTKTIMSDTIKAKNGELFDDSDGFVILLSLEQNTGKDEFFIKVSIREYEEFDYFEDRNICFRCIINPSNEDSVNECSATIAEGLHGLTPFLPTTKLRLMSKKELIDGEDPHIVFINKLITTINEHYKNY